MFISENTTFAEVSVDIRGYRRLFLDGHRFGMHYQHVNEDTSWRCTSVMNNRTTRCDARIRTRVINGYEMIKNVDVKHGH